jgi:hypothetical protein
MTLVPAGLEGVVKYRGGVVRAIKKFGSEKSVKERAIMAVEKRISPQREVESGCIAGGEAFGFPVEVLFWIVKA